MRLPRRLIFVSAIATQSMHQVYSFSHGRLKTTSLHSNANDENIISKSKDDRATVVVVGSGVGGLSVSSRIAASKEVNAKVIVLEKNSKDMTGGRCGSFDRVVEGYGTFRHERGPSLLLLKDVYLDHFKDCSRKAQDFGLVMKQCKPAYQIIFDDGDKLTVGFPSDMDDEIKQEFEASKQKMNEFETDGYKKWQEYLRATEAFLECGLPNFIEERLDLASFPKFVIEAVKDNFKSWPLKPHSVVLDNTFESRKMKALASFQDLYVGLEPYENKDEIGGGVLRKTAPAVFGLLAAIELGNSQTLSGVFAPVGGFRAVSTAFQSLSKDLGTEFFYDTTVTSIEEDGVWYEQDDEQKFLEADLVICNPDLPFANAALLSQGKDHKARYDYDDKFDYSSGVIAFHWSLNTRCNSLKTHNVFLSTSTEECLEKSWAAIRYNDPSAPSFDGDEFPFNFYVHRASETDETAAPEGCDSLLVLVPCCTLLRDEELSKLSREEALQQYKNQFDNEFLDRVKTAVIKRFAAVDSLENINELIIDEVIDTPATYADMYNVVSF